MFDFFSDHQVIYFTIYSPTSHKWEHHWIESITITGWPSFKLAALTLVLLLFVCSVAQLCPNLCDPMDWGWPSSHVPGIFQARILELEWVAISYSRGSSRPRDWTRVSCTVGSLLDCRQILYYWATREAPQPVHPPLNISWHRDPFKVGCNACQDRTRITLSYEAAVLGWGWKALDALPSSKKKWGTFPLAGLSASTCCPASISWS